MNVRKVLKWIVLVPGALFVLFSLLPYLIPEPRESGNRHQLSFANSEYAEVGGVELHYRSWEGSNQGSVNMLLVHGLGGSTFSWRYTAPALESEGYRVVAVDLPGFGLSERRQGLDHTAPARAGRLWAFLDERYPGEQWNLVGHSMGGAVVTAMALQEPQKVKSITLVAGALAESEPSFFNSFLHYPPVSRWIRILGPGFLRSESRLEQVLASAYGREPSIDETAGYYRPLAVENTAAVLVDLLKTSPVSLVDRLDELALPVLCVWGVEDTWVPLEQGERLLQLIPRSRLVAIEGEGHCPMETSPEQFNAILADFLVGLDSP